MDQALAGRLAYQGIHEFVDIFLRKIETAVMILIMTNSTAEVPRRRQWRPGGERTSASA
jgi:hypothetical protein